MRLVNKLKGNIAYTELLQHSLQVCVSCFAHTNLQLLQNSQYDRMVKAAETELVSTRIMLKSMKAVRSWL